MSLIHFIRTLLKRKWLLITIPLLSMAAGLFFLRNTPDVFVSEAVLTAGIVDDTKIELQEDKMDNSAFVIQTKFSNIIQQIKSKSVVDLLSYKLLLHDLSTSNPFRNSNEIKSLGEQDKKRLAGILSDYLNGFKLLAYNSADEQMLKNLLTAQKYTYDDILKKLKISRNEFSDFILLEFESENALLSAFTLNSLCEIFIAYYKNNMTFKTTNSVDFFRKMAEEKKAELNAMVDNLKQFKLDNKIINLYEQTKSIVNQISALELHREDLQKQIPSLNQALQNINTRFSPTERKYIEVKFSPSNEKLSWLKDKVNELNTRIITQGTTKELQDSIASTKKQLKEAITSLSNDMIVNPLVSRQDLIQKKLNYELELQMAQEGVKSNDKELKRLYKIVESFAPSEASISSFEREISVAAESYLVILNKLNLAKFSVESIGNNLQQTQKAIASDKPEPNKKSVVIILIGFITFLLVVVIIFILDYLDLTVQSAGRFTKFAGFSPVGLINRINNNSVDLRKVFNSENSSVESNLLKNSLRRLRTSVINGIPAGSIILITSARNGMGKTFLTTALAFSLRLSNKKVLMSDLNTHSNKLTENFGVSSLINRETLVAVQPEHTVIDGVDILGISQSPLTLSEMLDIKTFSDKLTSLKSSYDYILVDCPSLSTDTVVNELIPYTDKVLCVQAADTIFSGADKTAISEIAGFTEKFGGCILNKMDLEYMEDAYGDIPKKRSRIRQFVKQLFSRELRRNNKTNLSVIVKG